MADHDVRPRSGGLVRALAAAVFMAAALPAAAAELEVLDAAFTQHVNPAQRSVMERLDKGIAPRGPLSLWMEIKADSEALDALKRQGRLPLYHLWAKVVGTSAVSERADLIDRIDLGIGSEALFQPLYGEVEKQGFFTWRTWSGKTNPRPGTWTVIVVDNRGIPLQCKGVACTYTITIEP